MQIRSCTALQSAELQPDKDFPVGLFEVPSDPPSADPITVALIAVATIEDRVVVVVPFAAWHRTVLRRVLPPGALLKPLPPHCKIDRTAEEGENPLFETAKVCGLEFWRIQQRAQSSLTQRTRRSLILHSPPLTLRCSLVWIAWRQPCNSILLLFPQPDSRLQLLEQSVQSIAASLQQIT